MKQALHDFYLILKQQLLDRELELPGMPDIAQRVQRAINNPDYSAADISKIIQTDLPLSVRIIHVANSPLYKGGMPVENCQVAVTRLGMNVIRNLVTSFSVKRLYTAKTASTRQAMEILWKHSVKIGAIGFTLARITPGFDPERAMLAGLVHDIGELLILQFSEKQPGLKEDPELLRFFIQTFKYKLGAVVLKQWRFEKDIVEVALSSEKWWRAPYSKPDYTDVILVAHIQEMLISKSLPKGVQHFSDLPVYNKFPIFKLGSDAHKELLSESQDEIAELQRLLR